MTNSVFIISTKRSHLAPFVNALFFSCGNGTIKLGMLERTEYCKIACLQSAPPHPRVHHTNTHKRICIYHKYPDTHTYLHAYLHTYLHTYVRTYIPTYACTYIHACMHTYIHACMHAYIHTQTHI